MLRGLWSSACGMAANKMTIDVIANNLANVNTVGFKRSRADFQDLMYQTLTQAGSKTPDGSEVAAGIQIGMGTMATGVQKMFLQGDFQETKNDLDMAIEGKGFFKVLSNGEEFYTRAGNFKLDSEGNVVTPGGDRLQPEITVPAETVSVSIDKSGSVTAFDFGGQGTVLGVIDLHTFPNPAGLYGLGRNLYKPTDASGTPTTSTPGTDGTGTLAQGFLEMSNVDVVEEMVHMIIAQRAYEISSKAIQTADNMMQIANNLKR
jgi:flagellar basal-body rod protein FlgG